MYLPWIGQRKRVLKYVHFLKANEHEMEVLTGYTDAVNAGKVIYDWGVKEVLLTFGSMGSIILRRFHFP